MSYEAMFQQALALFDQERFDEAADLLRQIDETAPDNPNILNMLGLVAQAKGLHSEACSYFAAALRDDKNNPAYHYNLAFSLKACQNFADALLHFETVLKLAPAVKEAFNEMACIYERLGQLDKARDYWREALKIVPDYLTAKINLANSYRTENLEKAKTNLLALTKTAPNEQLLWYDLAWIYYEEKSYENALSAAQKADNIPNDSVKHILGLACLALGQKGQAKEAFLSAEKINPNNADALLCLADILSRGEDFEKAEARYKRVIELRPDDFSAHNNYAEMLFRQKRLSEALEEYRKAVILNPKSAPLSNNLGAVIKELKDYEKALELFFNALSLNPTLTEASVNIAETLVLLAREEPEKALQIADNWLKSYPENVFAKHVSAALKGENCEDNLVFTEKLFDGFADNYELVMQNLGYSAPMAFRRIAGNVEGRLADLGCGSGLVGLALKTPQNQIIGVDVSAQMLAKAAEKNVYDELVKDDLIHFLKERNDFETIVAADVLGYLGAADEFIKLSKNKTLLFSIEASDEQSDYQIQPSGRFKHNPAYIEKLLHQNGFCDIYKEETVLRTENGNPVNGYIFKALGGLKNGR